MPNKFPMLKDGDVLTPKILNDIHAELNRWRGMTGTGLIDVDGADQTSSPTIVDNRKDGGLVPAILSNNLASGTTTTPTTSTMTLLVGTGTSGGFTTTGGTTGVTVHNTLTFSATITGGTHIWVAPYGGRYYLIQASC